MMISRCKSKRSRERVIAVLSIRSNESNSSREIEKTKEERENFFSVTNSTYMLTGNGSENAVSNQLRDQFNASYS